MNAIEFDSISKQYRLGRVGTGTLSSDLSRWWAMNVLHKEDPYLKIGETNDRSSRGNSDYVWALKDISFNVEQGDVVGIIGKNGAGKSTLLKLLSKVTSPTTGEIRSRGRIGTLLEVGTGFHPEMTGRENIYMNGAILGMTKQEIKSKLDEIIDFSGCERYIDTPVKRYSSGMTVRLGFAVAAHLEPEILVVDEVLAVGDAEFQKKAIGKMQDISKGQGRTVLFVSHNMNAVKMLCNNGIVLKNGMVDFAGKASDCVDHYLEAMDLEKDIKSHTVITNNLREGNGMYLREVDFREIWLNNQNPEEMATDEPLDITIRLNSDEKFHGKYQLAVVIMNKEGQRVAYYLSEELNPPKSGDFDTNVIIKNHALPKGLYTVRLETLNFDFSLGAHPMDYANDVLKFEIRYVHKDKKDEYLHWESSWGMRLHANNEMIVSNVAP